MDLSFINLPKSKSELLGLLKIAYDAGYNTRSQWDNMGKQTIAIGSKDTPPQGTFNQWLNRLANQWSNTEE